MTTPHSFNRTTCACVDCTKCCKRQPGPLAPGDYEKIQHHLRATDNEMKSMFVASPGAIIRDESGKLSRVGSITPKRHRSRCVFLDENDRCKIHNVAPFGCAFFDTHMSREAALPRSTWLVKQQMKDQNYTRLRDALPYAGSYKPTNY